MSDRNVKHGFAAVDSTVILASVASLPITTWTYDHDPDSVRHIGPMAQDFAGMFSVGSDDRHIYAIDESGVALAAIQGLNQVVLGQETRFRQMLAAKDARIDQYNVRSNRSRGK